MAGLLIFDEFEHRRLAEDFAAFIRRRPRVHIAAGMYKDGVPICLVEGGHAQLTRVGAHGFDITIYFDEGVFHEWGAMEIHYTKPTGGRP